MGDLNSSLNTAVTVVNGCFIVTVPNHITDDDIKTGISNILIKVSKSSVRGLIFDLSTISSLDSYGFKLLEDASRTVSLLGITVVWAGLSPGVVSALMDLMVDVSSIKAARDLEQGINMILNTQ